MVQEFYVLKCHACELFQVHIVKKAKKWSCKVCGQKQSVVRVFGQGSAKDCRIHVQKLNQQQGQNSKNSNEKYDQIDDCYEPEAAVNADKYSMEENVVKGNDDLSEVPGPAPSKWQKYLESDETDELSDDTNVRKQIR